MKNLIILLLIAIGLTSCEKEEELWNINDLPKNEDSTFFNTIWLTNHGYVEFSTDTFIEYSQPIDTKYVGVFINDSTNITIYYKYYSTKNVTHTLTDTFKYKYKISNDSLYLNGSFKGIKQ